MLVLILILVVIFALLALVMLGQKRDVPSKDGDVRPDELMEHSLDLIEPPSALIMRMPGWGSTRVLDPVVGDIWRQMLHLKVQIDPKYMTPLLPDGSPELEMTAEFSNGEELPIAVHRNGIRVGNELLGDEPTRPGEWNSVANGLQILAGQVFARLLGCCTFSLIARDAPDQRRVLSPEEFEALGLGRARLRHVADFNHEKSSFDPHPPFPGYHVEMQLPAGGLLRLEWLYDGTVRIWDQDNEPAESAWLLDGAAASWVMLDMLMPIKPPSPLPIDMLPAATRAEVLAGLPADDPYFGVMPHRRIAVVGRTLLAYIEGVEQEHINLGPVLFEMRFEVKDKVVTVRVYQQHIQIGDTVYRSPDGSSAIGAAIHLF